MAPAGVSSAAVRDCAYQYRHGPKNDSGVPLGNVSARNMTCSAALRGISNGRLGGERQPPHRRLLPLPAASLARRQYDNGCRR